MHLPNIENIKEQDIQEGIEKLLINALEKYHSKHPDQKFSGLGIKFEVGGREPYPAMINISLCDKDYLYNDSLEFPYKYGPIGLWKYQNIEKDVDVDTKNEWFNGQNIYNELLNIYTETIDDDNEEVLELVDEVMNMCLDAICKKVVDMKNAGIFSKYGFTEDFVVAVYTIDEVETDDKKTPYERFLGFE